MPILHKGAKLYSVVKCKCPRCMEGDLFLHKNPYSSKGMFDMPDRCPVCGQDFQIEPGFYLGAMWVSYPIVIALIIVFIALGHFVLGLHMVASFLFATVLLLLLCPPLIRYSRAIYLNIFV
jgi:uncharacterized protein (DUF983 family)